jgi:hypothetical protein
VRMEDQETDRSRNSKIPSAYTGMDDSETWPIRLIYCWTLKDRGTKLVTAGPSRAFTGRPRGACAAQSMTSTSTAIESFFVRAVRMDDSESGLA